MHHLLGQQPGLRVVDVLVLGVLHPDVPPHAIAMRPVFPLEGGLNAQLHPQNRPAERQCTVMSAYDDYRCISMQIHFHDSVYNACFSMPTDSKAVELQLQSL